MTTAICARCAQNLHPGDHVVDVRKVTRIYDDGTIATDRADENGTAHLDCPQVTPSNQG